jgi:DNA processing protein
MEKEIVSSMALGKIFGFEPRIALAMIENLGSASAVFDLSPSSRDDLLPPYSKHRGKMGDECLQMAHEDYVKLSHHQAYFLPYTASSYPLALKEIADPPVGLYVRSSSSPEELFTSSNVLCAVVGTRKATPYGQDMCRQLLEAMAQVEPPPVIVSGLAYGVDICAHRQALQCRMPTLGVMASGIDAVYPYRHQREAEQMVETPGCALVSDYPLHTSPVALNFVRRNRIIAGLSHHTILIESKVKGGGMITARLAFDYGRELYALPGRVSDPCSQGCNYLIAKKMAEPIWDVAQTLSAMGFSLSSTSCDPVSEQKKVQRIYEEKLPSSDLSLASQLLLSIRSELGIYLSELSQKLSCPEVKLMNLATMLEADGLIEVDILKRCRIRP